MIDKFLPLILLLGLGCSAQNANVRDADGNATAGSPASREQLREAERLMSAGEIDDALLITDAVLKDDPDDRAARILAARGNVALYRSGRQGSEWFLDDAIRNLEAALESKGDDPQALLTLSWCRLKKSEFDEGRGLALQAATLLREQNASNKQVAEALMQAAENEMQIFVDARRAEMSEGVERPSDDSEGMAAQVLSTLRTARKLGAGSTARVRSAQVFQWMNRGKDALNELEAGVLAEPDSPQIHEAFQNLYWNMGMRAECVSAYKRLLDEASGSSALTWYLGRAQVAYADDLRTKTRFEDAVRVYGEALASFRRYDRLRKADHEATAQWLAICELSLGRVAFEQGNLDDAIAHYEAAYDASSLVAELDADGRPRVFDSFGGNYLGGLSQVGETISESSEPDALLRSFEFFERIIERHPSRFGAIYNNAALSARDLGVQIAAGGATEASAGGPPDDATRRARLTEAMALWEKSYAYYNEAVRLEPNDPRIVNDCGLMLIYHLHRDYDRARELFDEAVRLGEQQLAALPEGASRDERQFLEEATGDAYQNIGVLLQDRLGQPFADAKPFFEKSVPFYPYQLREAAQRLRAGTGAAAVQDPRKTKFDQQIAKGKQAAADGDFDSALLEIDRMAKEMNGYAPYHYFAGLWSLGYAEKAAREGGDAGLVDGLFQDAARNLAKSVELDGEPLEPRYELGRALLATSATAEATDVATSLLSHARSVGGAPPEFLVRVHALRAEAAARAFVSKKQAGENDEELLRTMRTSFREIEATDAFDDQKRSLWIASEQWAGAGEQAVQVMVRAWERNGDLVGELVQIGAQAGASGPVVEALRGKTDTTSLWYAGKAHFDLAVQQWSGGEAPSAIETLDAGIRLFAASMQENEGYRDSCEQWTALCLGQKGIIQISQDDLTSAEESLVGAVEARPDVFTNDLGGGSTIKRGILIVADRHFRANDLGRVAAIYRRVGAAAPADVDIANNEGLFCRDFADQLGGRRGELTEQTRDLYEASYAAYTRASELDPSNVRLRNDRALILVYSLKRELDLAERILKTAVADGERQLAESPPTDAKELRDLQEAVGDAYGNLGVLYRDQQKWAEAREVFTKSLEFYPFRQRAGVRELLRIDELEKKDKDGV